MTLTCSKFFIAYTIIHLPRLNTFKDPPNENPLPQNDGGNSINTTYPLRSACVGHQSPHGHGRNRNKVSGSCLEEFAVDIGVRLSEQQNLVEIIALDVKLLDETQSILSLVRLIDDNAKANFLRRSSLEIFRRPLGLRGCLARLLRLGRCL